MCTLREECNGFYFVFAVVHMKQWQTEAFKLANPLNNSFVQWDVICAHLQIISLWPKKNTRTQAHVATSVSVSVCLSLLMASDSHAEWLNGCQTEIVSYQHAGRRSTADCSLSDQSSGLTLSQKNAFPSPVYSTHPDNRTLTPLLTNNMKIWELH